MTENEKWSYINNLEEEILKVGAILSEWTVYLIKDVQIAFCSGAYLASIITCAAVIETHLKNDYFPEKANKPCRFEYLINGSPISKALKKEIHKIRKFRNKWVHVSDPYDDFNLNLNPDYYEDQILNFAKFSIKIMFKVIYKHQLI